MHWKEDSTVNNKDINNRPTNIENSSNNSYSIKQSLENSINSKNGSTRINSIVNKKSMDKISNVDSASNDGNSCSTRLRVSNKNEFDNSAIFSPSGSKKKKLEQQNVKASF
jgi:hypothetical protein